MKNFFKSINLYLYIFHRGGVPIILFILFVPLVRLFIGMRDDAFDVFFQFQFYVKIFTVIILAFPIVYISTFFLGDKMIEGDYQEVKKYLDEKLKGNGPK